MLLLLVFRSLLVPLKAVVGFLLTIAAALGLMVWVFQDGHAGSLIGIDTTSPIVSFLPIIMVALLFGLAMDYEVFLVSRIRESYVHDGGATDVDRGRVPRQRPGRDRGRDHHDQRLQRLHLRRRAVIKSIGLGLAFGVFVDAFFVRMTLVPAVLAFSEIARGSSRGSRSAASERRHRRRLAQ